MAGISFSKVTVCVVILAVVTCARYENKKTEPFTSPGDFFQKLKFLGLVNKFKKSYDAVIDLGNSLSTFQFDFKYLEKFVSQQMLKFNISTSCANDSLSVLSGLMNSELWAIKMLDAAGKPQSGLADFRLTWYGAYDECVRLPQTPYNTTPPVEPQYCTAILPLITLEPEKVFTVLESPIWKVSMRLPGLNVGICVPSGCGSDDVTIMLNLVLGIVKQEGLFVGKTLCQKPEVTFDSKAWASAIFFSALAVFISISTICDIFRRRRGHMDIGDGAAEGKIDCTCKDGYSDITSGKERNTLFTEKVTEETCLLTKLPDHEYGRKKLSICDVLVAFSVYNNGRKLLDTKQSQGTIEAINGMRFLSLTWVILGHSYAFGIAYGDNSTTFLPEMLFRWPYYAVLNGFFAVDTFFAISGTLVGYLVVSEIYKNNGKMNWLKYYFHRVWRLTPPYMLVLFFYVPLFPYFLDGPRWAQNGLENGFCQDTWWTNLLYVNNFVYVDRQCMAWCWYLANEMQFFLLSPLFLLPLFYWPMIGVAVCVLVLLVSTIITGTLSTVNDLPPSMFDATVDDPDTSAQSYLSDYYIKPYCRIGPYIVGILTGFLLYKTKRQIILSKKSNALLWCLMTSLALTLVYGLYDPWHNAKPLSTEVASLFNATSHTLWGICACWVILACATGNAGFVNSLLSWKAFVPLSRLTYSTYLIHPVVMYVFYGSLRTPYYFGDYSAVNMFLGNLVMAYLAGFVVCVAFESPMLAVEKLMLRSTKKVDT